MAGILQPQPSSETINSWVCDNKLARQRLAEDAPRLFAKEGDVLEIWRLQDGAVTALPIRGLAELAQYQDNVFENEDKKNTLSRFLTAWGTFEAILDRENVFPFFFRTVHSFGWRLKEDHSTWDNLYWRRSGSCFSRTEICYTVRFFERNNRGRGDPWSLRQTGIYQSMQLSTKAKTMILIQPSFYIESRLKCLVLPTKTEDNVYEISCILPHITILIASLVNWDEYLATQVLELEQLEEKAIFSKADYFEVNDFNLRFSDRQALQRLRKKLLKAARLLDSSIHLGKRMQQLWIDESIMRGFQVSTGLVHELEDHIVEASYHRRFIADLLQRSTDTCDLLTNILQYRAGSSTLDGTRTLVKIAEQGEKDGKTSQMTSVSAMSLTFAATVYLPASLLAGIFSSNLVDVKNDHFVLAQDFWKFIVILIPLVIATFALVRVSQWHWKRSHKLSTNYEKTSEPC